MEHEGKLRIVKLLTNEEILGIVFDGKNYINESNTISSEDMIFIREPMMLKSVYQDLDASYSFLVSPWIPASDSAFFPIAKRNILTIVDAANDIAEQYYNMVLLNNVDGDIQ